VDSVTAVYASRKMISSGSLLITALRRGDNAFGVKVGGIDQRDDTGEVGDKGTTSAV
jgi:hypothetical protein